MRISEIKDRLRDEFPDRRVSFDLEVWNDDTPPRLSLWTNETKEIMCKDLDDGIERLKLQLGTASPEMQIVGVLGDER